MNANLALAVLILQKQEQKKVSVLTGSMDDCGLGGFILTIEHVTVGPNKSPRDFAISITTYTANICSGILTSNPTAATGQYPQAYIASGKTMSAKVQDGKVIHVPYAD